MKNTTMFLLLGVIVLGGVGYGLIHKKNSSDSMMKKEAMEESMNKDSMMKKDEMTSADTMMKDTTMDKDEMMKKDTMMAKAGTYEIYTPAKVSQATGKIVLFFNASWCPTCRSADADIKANLNKIPTDTQILSVDYDTSGDLKKKYGVTTQHTFVQVDPQGNKVASWKGGDLNTIISNLK